MPPRSRSSKKSSNKKVATPTRSTPRRAKTMPGSPEIHEIQSTENISPLEHISQQSPIAMSTPQPPYTHDEGPSYDDEDGLFETPSAPYQQPNQSKSSMSSPKTIPIPLTQSSSDAILDDDQHSSDHMSAHQPPSNSVAGDIDHKHQQDSTSRSDGIVATNTPQNIAISDLDDSEITNLEEFLGENGVEIPSLDQSKAAYRHILAVFLEDNTVHSIKDLTQKCRSKLQTSMLKMYIGELCQKGYIIPLDTPIEDAQNAPAYQLNQAYIVHLPNHLLPILDHKNEVLSHLIDGVITDLKYYDSQIQQLQTAPTTEDLKVKLNILKKHAMQKRQRIERFKTVPIEPEYRERLKKLFNEALQHWKQRKLGAYQLMQFYLDTVKKTRKMFLKELGIDTDEDLHVDSRTYLDFKREFIDPKPDEKDGNGQKNPAGSITARSGMASSSSSSTARPNPSHQAKNNPALNQMVSLGSNNKSSVAGNKAPGAPVTKTSPPS